jgi:hypothetical protein
VEFALKVETGKIKVEVCKLGFLIKYYRLLFSLPLEEPAESKAHLDVLMDKFLTSSRVPACLHLERGSV